MRLPISPVNHPTAIFSGHSVYPDTKAAATLCCGDRVDVEIGPGKHTLPGGVGE
jgi:hypothetical protein